MRKTSSVLLGLVLFWSALPTMSCSSKKQPLNTPAFVSTNTVNCIIEIPAGTNKKIEFNKSTNTFEVDKRNGKQRIKEYLPYPANYGFVPSTFSDPQKGGDGDPIDVLLLCESLPTGSVVEAYPIGILRLVDEGQMDDKVICIPKDPALQIMQAKGLEDFNKKHPMALEILKLWFQHNDPSESITIQGWSNEREALAELKKLAGYFKDAE
ncbi:inorganic pyrophosphatase [Marinirhabdus gelatinilytica]|uniref:inorganic diphosphatase n=1 Tax=Marinirhabdus gelatinilytica TaxID=1703343 RepID=A0A370QLB6_9FLAO|nr:inorganic pyrophosphatase [Marinirhabdus gelatinilytica]